MPTPAEEYDAIRQRRLSRMAAGGGRGGVGGVAKKVWDVANAPLIEAPARWARQASDWMTTPELDDSWGTAVAKGALGGMTEGVGNVVSGLTSPVGIATTLLGLGSTKYAATAVPALAELAASRPAAIGLKALSGAGAAHGAYKVGEGVVNPENKSTMGRLGDVGSGGLELIAGLAGTRLPIPEAPPKATPPRMSTGTPMKTGPDVPKMLGDVEGVTTSTSARFKASPSTGSRMSTVQPTKVSSGMAKSGLPARDISPERAAFEALVPNRYKTELTSEGLRMNVPPHLQKVEAPTTTAKPEAAPATSTTSQVTPPKKVETPKATATAPTGTTRSVTAEEVAKTAKAVETAPPKPPKPPKTPKPTVPPPPVGEPPSPTQPAAVDRKATLREAATKAKAERNAAANAKAETAKQTLIEKLQADVEKAKAARAAQVATPVEGQAGVTPVPEGVTVTKVKPGQSGVVEKKAGRPPKAPAEAKVEEATQPVTTQKPKGAKQAPVAPATIAASEEGLQAIASELRSQGIPEAHIADIVARGRAQIAGGGDITAEGLAPANPIVEVPQPKAKAPKAAVPPKTAKVIKAEKKAAPAPAMEGIPEKTPSAKRPLAFAKDEKLDELVKKGDKVAAQEQAWRAAEEKSSFLGNLAASVKAGAKKVIGEETGAVGPGTGDIIRRQRIAREAREMTPERIDQAMQDVTESLPQDENGRIYNPAGHRVANVEDLPIMQQEVGPEMSQSPRSPWQMRLFDDETGAVGNVAGVRQPRPSGGQSPLSGWRARAADTLENLNQLRMGSMLSGLAVPKSILGNIGAHFTAAAENRSMAPIKALGDFGNIGRDIAEGWNISNSPQLGGQQKSWNIPGRILGAGDHAATKSLMRAGLSEAAAKEILLTNPNPVSGWEPLNTGLGKLAVPFKTTPFNQFGQGLSRYLKHPGIYAGAAGLGAGAGMLTDDPEKLALGAGFVGPYALPFTMGAMATAGARAGQGLSPIPEWSLQKSFTDPLAPFTESPGFRWFEPNFGFGSQNSSSETGSSRPKRTTPTRPHR